MGVTSKTKNIFLCGAHIHPNYIYGKVASKFAVPYPRGQKPAIIKVLKVRRNVHTDDETQFNNIESASTEAPQVNFTPDIVDEPQNHTLEPEMFELCDPDSGNPVLNGCFFENDEFIMTSYTSKSKLTHKEQVKILNEKYEKQAKYLERLRREHHSLVKNVRRQEILFSQLRKIKAKNETLRKGIKKYEKMYKKLGKSLKEKKLI